MDPHELSFKQLLDDYFQRLSREFSASFIACQKSFNRKNIHDLRLALKNLYALFHLINLLNTRRRRKPLFPGPLEKLFDHLGKIRDLQIMEEELRIHEEELNTRFRKQKSKIKQQQSQRTEKILPLLMNLKFGIEINRIHAYLNEVCSLYRDEKHLLATFRSHLLKSWKKIQIQLKHKHTQKNLHMIRIQIKHLGYMASVFRQEEQLISGLPFRFEALDEFQELLGLWHDQVVFYNRIKDEMTANQGKRRMKLYFLLGTIRKKRGKMSRRVSLYCAKILKKSATAGKPEKSAE
jgi:CHAD domain-containing protein